MNSHTHIRAMSAISTMAATGRPMVGLPTGQRGISLITAIFVLVVLAGLGSYMVSISGTQHFTTLHALQGAKAYHAARSGVEWGISRVNSGDDCNGTLSPGGALSDFSIIVTCAPYASPTPTQITATAITGTIGSPGYAARQISATVITGVNP